MPPLVGKIIVLGVIGALLLVPLMLVLRLVQERSLTRDRAEAELASAWGGNQEVVGPVLVVPYLDGSGAAGRVHFLPEQLTIDGDLPTQVRARGIYASVVYSADLHVRGRFAVPDPSSLNVPAEALRWDEAFVAISASDLRGVTRALTLTWDGHPRALETGSGLVSLPRGLHAPLTGFRPGTAPIAFAFDLELRGSGALRLVPLATTTEATLRSPWGGASFQGAFLPVERRVDARGFTARWAIGEYGRDVPARWSGDDALLAGSSTRDAQFGVDLMVVVDAYRQVERSVKYGALFVLLVIAGFFTFELRTKRRLHPVQYALVGAAVAVFFLVLLALSEVVAFPIAYGGATLVCAGLNALYARAVLGTARRGVVVLAAMTGGFAMLYVPLALEAYALLAGTAAVVAVVALLMWLTRRVHHDSDAPETA